MTVQTSASSLSSNAKRWLALAVFVGLVLRIWEALESSLWLDETHTLFHASQPSIAAVLDTVKRDFHVPLFFVFVHACGDFASGAWLRWIPIVSSLAALVPLVALARETRGGERAAVATAWLYATIPYQVHYGAELRPYAWVELFSACAAWAAFSERGSKRTRGLVFLAAVGLGMATHVITAIAVVSIGAARLFVRRSTLVGLPVLIAVGALAVLPTVPWLWSFHTWSTEKRAEYVEQVGETGVRPALVREVRDLPLRLVEPVIGSLGAPWSAIGYAGTALFAVCVAWLAIAVWRGRRTSSDGDGAWLLRAVAIYALVQFVLITIFSLRAWDRVPLQYYVGMSWAIPLVLGAWLAAVDGERARRTLQLGTVAAACVLGVALAGGESRENFRGAVELARRWGSELVAKDAAHPPIYSAVLAQPSGVFEHVLPYRAYGSDLGAVEPDRVPTRESPDFARHLIVIRRALPLEHPRWKTIVEGREIVRVEQIHERIWVYEFAPKSR